MKSQLKNSGRQLFICILLLTMVNIFDGCKKKDNGPTSPGANEVWMQNTSFNPSSLTVKVNTTVTWTNKDGMDHNVTSDNSLFSSGTVSDGGTYSRQFTTSGTFHYSCTIHSGMKGTIIVQ